MSESDKFVDAMLFYVAASQGIPVNILKGRMMIENEKRHGFYFMRRYNQAGPWADMLKERI